jgi:hypothetical protein
MVSSSCYPLHFLHMVVETIPAANIVTEAEVFSTRNTIEANIHSFVFLQTFPFFRPSMT